MTEIVAHNDSIEKRKKTKKSKKDKKCKESKEDSISIEQISLKTKLKSKKRKHRECDSVDDQPAEEQEILDTKHHEKGKTCKEIKQDSIEIEETSVKTKLKSKKRKHQGSDSVLLHQLEKDEEAIKPKKSKKVKDVVPEVFCEKSKDEPKKWNDWNSMANSLGDDAKKSKFLRLMGVKKTSAENDTKTGESATNHLTDLEKQFETARNISLQYRKGKRGGIGSI